MKKKTENKICSIGGWCYSGWWVVDLRTFTEFQGSEISPGILHDFTDGYIKLSTLTVEHSVVVMTSSSQLTRSQIESCG